MVSFAGVTFASQDPEFDLIIISAGLAHESAHPYGMAIDNAVVKQHINQKPLLLMLASCYMHV